MLPLRIIGTAAVDRQFPGAVNGIAHRIATAIVVLADLADQNAAFAVLARFARGFHALARDPFAGMAVGIAHPASQSRTPRGQRASRRGVRQAIGQGHGRAAHSALGFAAFQPVQDRGLPGRRTAVSVRRRVDRPVIAPDTLEAFGLEVDQQRVFAVARPQPAFRPSGPPAGPGRRHRAGPFHRAGGLGQDMGLQPAPGGNNRAGMRQRFLAVDALGRRRLRIRLRRQGGGQQRDPADAGQQPRRKPASSNRSRASW